MENDVLFTWVDGVDIYCSGCRSLPDNVTVTKCTLAVYDETRTKLGEIVNDIAGIEELRYDPSFHNCRCEIRKPLVNGGATLIIRIDTIDIELRKPRVVGYALFPIFRYPDNVSKQPISTDTKFILNEGCFQIPLRQGIYDLSKQTTVRADQLNHALKVPCSTVLIQICLAKKDEYTGFTYKSSQYIQPPPYKYCKYDSSRSNPTKSEVKLYKVRKNRTNPKIKEVLHLLYYPPPDVNEVDEIKKLLMKSFSEKPTLNINYCLSTEYCSTTGFQLSIIAVHGFKINYPIKVMNTIIPPGSFFQDGNSQLVFFTQKLRWESRIGNIYYDKNSNVLIKY